jgi:uncharacterized membrane protein
MANKKYGLFSVENTIDLIGALMVVGSLIGLFMEYSNRNPFVVPAIISVFVTGLLLSGFARILKRLAAIESLLESSSPKETDDESKLNRSISDLIREIKSSNSSLREFIGILRSRQSPSKSEQPQTKLK